MPTDEKVANWRGALKELRIDTDKKPVAVDDDELTPDSMSARINGLDSAIGMSPPRQAKDEDIKMFDPMSSRVNTLAA
jgi:hypothetical protein